MATVIAALVFGAGYACCPSLDLLTDWLYVLKFAGILLLAGVLGYFAALLLGLPILGPLYYGRTIKNGAPFQKGDYVRVLTGPFRDRVVRVYDVWASRGQVLVELSEEAKRRFEDVFSESQVCREEPPEGGKDTVSSQG